MTTLINLLNYGQSYWLDNLTREKISGGELKKRVAEQGLRGVTSNPSIFNKAISKSDHYDEQIVSLVNEEKTIEEIYDALTIKDVQDACDILLPVYEQSKGSDGFVSLEVPPYLSRDTQGTIKKALDLYKSVARPNCLIKVPGTIEGLPAIEQLLYEGVSINVTLIFSVERYEEVAGAYIKAIKRRIEAGRTVENIISVASIFLSRIDVLTDQLLSQHITSNNDKSPDGLPELLNGKAGVATARLVYQSFKQIFKSETWKKLEGNGAHVQRPLWASTSNKDPLFDDLRYVESLIGEDTINTLPEETIDTLADHGQLKANSIEEGKSEAEKLFTDLNTLGIDIDFITQQLENEGVKKFTDSYQELISNLAIKRLKILDKEASTQNISAGKLKSDLIAAYASIDEKQVGNLLFAMDPYLWKKDGKQLDEINHRLGWLTLPEHFRDNLRLIKNFATEVKASGYKHAVLLGMGGSSLCSQVAIDTYGIASGYLELLVLDNTAPEAIQDIERKIDISKTLFIVASKSGNTEETLSFFHYFHQQLKKKNKERPGDNFIAITDDGTPLVKMAEQYHFPKTFLNPPNLGGRYSVLSDFGLVPMGLMGIDINAFLGNARQMELSCKGVPAAANPGIALGAALGVCQKKGRDKVTFVLSSSISSFGYWVEQLLAESTGKEGKGMIPVNGETLGGPGVYSNDRIFIHTYLGSDNNKSDVEKLKLLEEAGHPVVRIELANTLALGGEYYRWEIAAAISGLVIGINPFDQPNVEESKKNTSDLLQGWEKENSFQSSVPLIKSKNISIYGGKQIGAHLKINAGALEDLVNGFTALAKPGDYIALLPYFMLTDKRRDLLQNWRLTLRYQLKVATTLLGGPRYLHSTGQLHKGGPDSGLYIIFMADESASLSIPGEKFGFETLHTAQALGDFRSLDEKERRVIRIHLGKNIDEGLEELFESINNSTIQPTRQR